MGAADAREQPWRARCTSSNHRNALPSWYHFHHRLVLSCVTLFLRAYLSCTLSLSHRRRAKGSRMSATATLATLREQADLYAEAYKEHLESAQSLQHTLMQDILPGMVDELDLQEEDEERARRWLGDLRTSLASYTTLHHSLTQPSPLQIQYSGYSGYA